MKKLLTLAACAALLSGCDFVGGGETIAFSNLTVTTTPLPADEDGTAPDLYIEIQDAGGRKVVEGDRIVEDADATDLPFVVTTSGELVGNARSYFIVVMDRDDDGYDLIARSESFNPDELRASSNSLVEIADEEGTIRAELTIQR